MGNYDGHTLAKASANTLAAPSMKTTLVQQGSLSN